MIILLIAGALSGLIAYLVAGCVSVAIIDSIAYDDIDRVFMALLWPLTLLAVIVWWVGKLISIVILKLIWELRCKLNK